MTIQGDRPDLDKPPARRAKTRVRVPSAGAQLASAALEAAKKAPEVRPQAVARGKALLERGMLGIDTEHLADALIDRCLAS